MEESKAIQDLNRKLGITSELIESINLPLQPEAKSLVFVGSGFLKTNQFLEMNTASAWSKMRKNANACGVNLSLVSGFRSYYEQAYLLLEKIHEGQSPQAIIKSIAPVGYSEHHTGRAIDIGQTNYRPGLDKFEETEAFSWLINNAEEHGFNMSYPESNPHKLIYEPWHWRYNN